MACSDREKIVETFTDRGVEPTIYDNNINDFYPVVKFHPCNHTYHLHCAFEWAKMSTRPPDLSGRPMFRFMCMQCNTASKRCFVFRAGTYLGDITDEYHLFALKDKLELEDISTEDLENEHKIFYEKIGFDPKILKKPILNESSISAPDFPGEPEIDSEYLNRLHMHYSQYKKENLQLNTNISTIEDDYIEFEKVVFDVDFDIEMQGIKEEDIGGFENQETTVQVCYDFFTLLLKKLITRSSFSITG